MKYITVFALEKSFIFKIIFFISSLIRSKIEKLSKTEPQNSVNEEFIKL